MQDFFAGRVHGRKLLDSPYAQNAQEKQAKPQKVRPGAKGATRPGRKRAQLRGISCDNAI